MSSTDSSKQRLSSDFRKPGHHQTTGSNVIRQQEGMSSPDRRKTETVKVLAFTALQLAQIHKQITSHKTDIPFGESAHRQEKKATLN